VIEWIFAGPWSALGAGTAVTFLVILASAAWTAVKGRHRD